MVRNAFSWNWIQNIVEGSSTKHVCHISGSYHILDEFGKHRHFLWNLTTVHRRIKCSIEPVATKINASLLRAYKINRNCNEFYEVLLINRNFFRIIEWYAIGRVGVSRTVFPRALQWKNVIAQVLDGICVFWLKCQNIFLRFEYKSAKIGKN